MSYEYAGFPRNPFAASSGQLTPIDVGVRSHVLFRITQTNILDSSLNYAGCRVCSFVLVFLLIMSRQVGSRQSSMEHYIVCRFLGFSKLKQLYPPIVFDVPYLVFHGPWQLDPDLGTQGQRRRHFFNYPFEAAQFNHIPPIPSARFVLFGRTFTPSNSIPNYVFQNRSLAHVLSLMRAQPYQPYSRLCERLILSMRWRRMLSHFQSYSHVFVSYADLT